MEMEERSYLCRDTTEELFIKTMMESPVGMPAPTMETLGFKSLAHNFRADSEELFKTWLTTGESSGCHSMGSGLRPRQASRRISTELAATEKKLNDETFRQTTTTVAAASSNDPDSTRTGLDRGFQASNLFLAKAWFQSSQPMTRSRSSELRRKYVAMQNTQTLIGVEAMQEAHGNAVSNFKQENIEANGLNNISPYENPHHFTSPSNSSSSPFNNPQVGSVDNISSIVSMLKGTIERKKLTNQVEQEAVEDSSLGYYSAAQVLTHACFNQEQGIQSFQNQGAFQDASAFGDAENRVLQTIEESLMEGIMGTLNPTQISTLSREPSQSESSAAAPVVSNGFDMSDDPYISALAPSVCESSRNQIGTGISPEDCSRTRDFRERIYDNSREDQKQGSLVRYGSIKSSGSVERGDPTKKRRVERSRKMAEAKEKSSTPPVPSDMQSVLKRCDNLEKEVRSLKLNLAFMNRKDSEQTKEIEELQKQNQELAEEKERLLEEIERIISDTGKM